VGLEDESGAFFTLSNMQKHTKFQFSNSLRKDPLVKENQNKVLLTFRRIKVVGF